MPFAILVRPLPRRFAGPSAPRALPALNPRKFVVTKDISCDFHKVAARFLTYTYLGYMATYLVPRIFDAMQLWA
jgi:hypothetical protein